MINGKVMYDLLKIIKNSGNIISLSEKGYEFSQIENFLNTLIEENYIKYTGGILESTEKGDIYIKEYEKENQIQLESKWILPRDEMWFEPMKLSAPYIPKKLKSYLR